MRRGCCGGYTPALSIFKKGLVSTSPVSISGPQFIQSGPTKQLMPLQTDTSNTVGSGYFSCLDWVIVWPSHSYSAPIISPHKSSFPISQLSFCCSFPQLPVSCKKHWTGLWWFVPWAPAEALWFFFFCPVLKMDAVSELLSPALLPKSNGWISFWSFNLGYPDAQYLTYLPSFWWARKAATSESQSISAGKEDPGADISIPYGWLFSWLC